MRLEVINYIEDSSGGASVTIDLDEEGKLFLIERGFNSTIRDAIDNLKAEEALSELARISQEDGDYDIEWWDHECVKQERDVMSFPKGVERDWCGMTEEVYLHNKREIEKMKQYEEWRKDEG